MGAMASQISSLTIVYSGTDQRKHESSASLAFVWEIHRWLVNSPHKWPVMRKMFPFDDVIMRHRALFSDNIFLFYKTNTMWTEKWVLMYTDKWVLIIFTCFVDIFQMYPGVQCVNGAQQLNISGQVVTALNAFLAPTQAAGTDYSLMMTSSNGNIFRVTGPLWGEFTGHRWIPLTKASDAELWCFLWSAPE